MKLPKKLPKSIKKMQPKDRRTERRKMTLKYEGKFFVFGVLIGVFLLTAWNFIFHFYTDRKQDIYKIDVVKQESEERLLNYIDGKWTSSIGDVIVDVNINKNKDFIILEIIKDHKVARKYKISSIDKVNGFFGIVKLSICDVKKQCNPEEIIPIQINKVFGMDRTITISYDSRLTYCVDLDDRCTRAFKRIE